MNDVKGESKDNAPPCPVTVQNSNVTLNVTGADNSYIDTCPQQLHLTKLDPFTQHDMDLAEELMWSLPMQLPKGQPRNVEVVDGLVWSDLTSP